MQENNCYKLYLQCSLLNSPSHDTAMISSVLGGVFRGGYEGVWLQGKGVLCGEPIIVAVRWRTYASNQHEPSELIEVAYRHRRRRHLLISPSDTGESGRRPRGARSLHGQLFWAKRTQRWLTQHTTMVWKIQKCACWLELWRDLQRNQVCEKQSNCIRVCVISLLT